MFLIKLIICIWVAHSSCTAYGKSVHVYDASHMHYSFQLSHLQYNHYEVQADDVNLPSQFFAATLPLFNFAQHSAPEQTLGLQK